MFLRYDSEVMPIQITIDDVPEELRDELAARAALKGQSLEEYLRREVGCIESRPSIEVWLREVRARKEARGTRVPPAVILRARDEGRELTVGSYPFESVDLERMAMS